MRKVPHFFFGLWGLILPLIPQTALSAEKIYFLYGPFNFPLSVNSLEVYAKEGKITKEFAFYASQFDEQTLIELRETLRKPHYIDGVKFSRLLKTPLMEDLLKSMGKIFSTHPNSSGFYAIRGALILAAIHQGEDGWTAIDVMRHFPTDSIVIDTQLATKMLKNSQF